MMILDLWLSKKELDRSRFKNALGLFSCYPAPHTPGGIWHRYKNHFSEWAKSDPQRAGKICHDLIVLVVILCSLLFSLLFL